MKKIACICLSVCLAMTLLCGCSKQNTKSNYSDDVVVEEIIVDDTSSGTDESSSNTETPDVPSVDNSSADNSSVDNPSQNTSSKADPVSCSHSYDGGKVEQKAELFKAGTKKYTCTKCGDSYTSSCPVEKIKLLSISNSFGKNALCELPYICEQAGVKEVDIAIMYRSGCSLDQHWTNMQDPDNDANKYTLYRYNSADGKWTWSSDDAEAYNTPITTVFEEDWDVIMLQNSPTGAANSQSFTNLSNVINYVSGKCPNAKILWHMTWAYQKDSQYLSTYQNDDILMYDKIIECVKSEVIPNTKIHSVVPVGTAVMNTRTSKLKDRVHLADGLHLSIDVGYYVAAFVWYTHLTGQSFYDFPFKSGYSIVDENIDIIFESAENALSDPYEITSSIYYR
ncbi:MAG: DUF4886 domain-containing protein [Clostridia bacterium]|nr:DUF4886 domain-containing protein [Clostridia bacterium]